MSAQQRKSCCAKIKLDRCVDSDVTIYIHREEIKLFLITFTSTVVRVQREGGRWLATTAAPFSLLLFAPLPRGRPSTEDSFRVRGEEFFRILLFPVRCECLFVSRLLFSFGRLVETWEKSGGKTRNLIFRGGSSPWKLFLPLERIFPFVSSFSSLENLCISKIFSFRFDF